MEIKQQQNKSYGENTCKRKMEKFIIKNDGERKV
jgi:hypothetical protein